MISDGELLRRYTETASEEAFGELVRRHLDLVYSAALRQVNQDSYLAQDVAQMVFSDLARKAGQLTTRKALAGWLFTSAHYAAAKAVRSEQRRQTHEQEAHAMQELLRNTGPDLDWAKLCPVLDAAMQELSETDREVILLRYFQNRPHAEIGQQIGLGENAARMRVERALEKLRAGLSRHGVTTAAGLAGVLSANAVGAAPAGLITTITTAATLAGTTAMNATIIATTKTVALTMLQKTLIGAAVAAAVGTGIYGVVQTSRLRQENQTLRREQSTLSEQLQALQQQRDAATGQLSGLMAENARLKAGQQAAGVMKLRGQVGALQQSLSNAASATGLEKIMNDPALRDYIHQAQLKISKERYAALVKELKLTPDQIDQFNQLVAQQWMKFSELASTAAQRSPEQKAMSKAYMDAKSEFDSGFQALLGADGFARYNEYNREIPARSTVELLDQQLGDSGLTDEQSARLIQIVTAEPYAATHGIAGEMDDAFLGSQADIAQHLQQVEDSNKHILDQAASFLDAQQLAALATVQSNSFNAQKIQGTALAQRH